MSAISKKQLNITSLKIDIFQLVPSGGEKKYFECKDSKGDQSW